PVFLTVRSRPYEYPRAMVVRRLLRRVVLLAMATVLALRPVLAHAACGSTNCGNLFDPCHTYACVGDTCVATPVDCDDGDECTDDSCHPLGIGCTHVPHIDACPTRLCTSLVCSGDPIPSECDDGDPSTVDVCTPATGSPDTPRSSTTTTLPSGTGGCGGDADCTPPADPCMLAVCRGGTCAPVPVSGFPSLSCICQRTDPPSCAGQPVPHAIGERRA